MILEKICILLLRVLFLDPTSSATQNRNQDTKRAASTGRVSPPALESYAETVHCRNVSGPPGTR